MAGVTAIRHRAVAAPIPVAVAVAAARVAQAAAVGADIANRSVVLLDADLAGGADLRALLMGMGVEVFRGPQADGIDGVPLLMFAASSRGRPEIAQRLGMARHVHPTAPLCVVTGVAPDCPPPAARPGEPHDDARALLQAAGIYFLSQAEV